jgi:hypothetical protein
MQTHAKRSGLRPTYQHLCRAGRHANAPEARMRSQRSLLETPPETRPHGGGALAVVTSSRQSRNAKAAPRALRAPAPRGSWRSERPADRIDPGGGSRREPDAAARRGGSETAGPPASRMRGGYRAPLARVLRRCDLLKASEEDLAWPHPDSRPVDTAQAMLAGGPQVAIVTVPIAREHGRAPCSTG